MLMSRIRQISSDTPKTELVTRLQPFIQEIAMQDPGVAELYLEKVVKGHFGLTDEELNEFRKLLSKYRRAAQLRQRILYFREVERYRAAGLSLIPICADGTKTPATKWQRYQKKCADSASIKQWLAEGHGLAVVGGAVSGGLEILDFDDPHAFQQWWELVRLRNAAILEQIVLVETPTGGYHVYYRHEGQQEGNQKLASKCGLDGKKGTMIETRGEGGYVLIPGGPESCHPSGKPYRLLQGDLAEIPTIRQEERHVLISSAKALDECVEAAEPANYGSPDSHGDRPGDEFNRTANWDEVLEPRGWIKVSENDGVSYWRRPGKEEGVSATTNYEGADLLYVFSTNADPFEDGKWHAKFTAFTLLNHGGDYSAAAADLAKQGYGDTSSASSSFSAAPEGWPSEMGDEAYHGILGEIVRAIDPHTEADKAAILGQLLVGLGNVVGKGPHFQIEADCHYTNFFLVLVGETSKARKGTSWGYVRKLMAAAAPTWAKDRVTEGLSSGEGLINEVRDGEEKSQGKTLLVMEGEFASVLKVMDRETNTLSPVLRNSWDHGNLNTLVKNNPVRATGAHISIIGHITREELNRLITATEAANGFGNRFLWICVRRSKSLPLGGEGLKDDEFKELAAKLEEAIDKARQIGRVTFDEEAKKLWFQVYDGLSEGKPGLLGAMIGRAEAQVLRIATLYAALDGSSLIRIEHLRAALAVWKYAEDSARYIFGNTLGDPLADSILIALRQQGKKGLSRTAINGLSSGHKAAVEIQGALNRLAAKNLVRCQLEETGGRPKETWYSVRTEEKAEKAEKEGQDSQ